MEFFSSAAAFCVIDFETCEVDVGVLECCGEDEESAAAADIELYGLSGVEEGIPVDRRADVIEGLEPGMEGPGLWWFMHGECEVVDGGCWREDEGCLSLSGFWREVAL